MQNQRTYTVEFSEAEINSLIECLAALRKHFVNDYNRTSNGTPPLQQPVFVAACELQHKIAGVALPNTKTSIEEYLDYGKTT